MRLFSVQDIVSGEFHAPFSAKNEGMAARMLQMALKADTPYKAHPHEHVFYELGAYDEATGALDALTPPRKICSLTDLLSG